MRRSLATIIATAAILLSGLAHADTIYQVKVYRTTADKLITDRRLTCTYGQWSSTTLPNGSTVLSRSKVCQ